MFFREDEIEELDEPFYKLYCENPTRGVGLSDTPLPRDILYYHWIMCIKKRGRRECIKKNENREVARIWCHSNWNLEMSGRKGNFMLTKLFDNILKTKKCYISGEKTL